MSALSWEAVGAGAGALGAAAAGAWKVWGRPWLEERRRRLTYDEVLKNSRIFVQMGSLLREWRAATGARRVLLLYARNNGSPWPVESTVKTSCLMQSVAQGVENTWKRWQDVEIDPPYRELLGDTMLAMRHERAIKVVRKDLSESMLKEAYDEYSIEASVIFGLRWMHESNALLYVSLNFDTEAHAHDLFSRPERVRSMMVDGKTIWKPK